MLRSDRVIIMFFRQKLEDRYQAKKQIANKQIYIRDIFVSAAISSVSHGEFHMQKKQPSAKSWFERLIDHVEILANIANEHHIHDYCKQKADNSYFVSSQHLNHITRLSLHEFSLYSKEPLTLAQYEQFVSKVAAFSEKLQPNVHLLLSSMAVVVTQDCAVNMSLYVQCGAQPLLRSFCKATKDPVDKTYLNMTMFKNPAIDDTSTEYTVTSSGLVLSHDFLFPVKTLGGAEANVAVEICLDHEFQVAKKLLFARVESVDREDTFFIPEQTDQLITSNTIQPYRPAYLTYSLAHVAPAADIKNTWLSSIHFSFGIQTLSKCLKAQDYPGQRLAFHYGGSDKIAYYLHNPSFGFDCHIVPMKERKLNHYLADSNSLVRGRNIEVAYKWMEEQVDRPKPI